jgi:hypothetical protein
MAIAKPGTYEYFWKEQPWSKRQLLVGPATEGSMNQPAGTKLGMFTPEQATRGMSSF